MGKKGRSARLQAVKIIIRKELTMNLKISKEQKTQIIGLIQHYFREERDEEIGDLAAEFLMDFMVKQLGPFIYNQAVEDVHTILIQKMASLEEDIDALKVPIKVSYWE